MAADRVCLFAQFDPQGRIRPHVLHYLAALRQAGFRIVLAASGPAPPPDPDLAAAAALGVQVVARVNAGLDFGAWRALLRAGHADGACSVLLANDSVYGPMGDLAAIVRAMDGQAPDAWGMVESKQGGWHLQSWFLHLTAEALRRPAVQRVFAQDFAAMTKPEIIVRGELALGAAFQVERLRCLAARRVAQGRSLARLVPTNAMHLDWKHLLTAGAVPFVKVELLRDNPAGIPWADAWPSVVAARAYPVPWIHAHLFAYTGRIPPGPDAPYPTPVPRMGFKLWLFHLLATRDRRAALAATARHAWTAARHAARLRRHNPDQGRDDPRTETAVDVRPVPAGPGDRRQLQSPGGEVQRPAGRDA